MGNMATLTSRGLQFLSPANAGSGVTFASRYLQRIAYIGFRGLTAKGDKRMSMYHYGPILSDSSVYVQLQCYSSKTHIGSGGSWQNTKKGD